ncbi:MAG TPA: hypothetical protein VE033_02880 [Acetobacteraceae bacterium]|jgi:hypothetical protein|nr:hypothetical protein [Acetobacteraceae bacterium]
MSAPEERQARHLAALALDRLLAGTPPCTAQEGMEAVARSVAWRDLLAARRRTEGPSPELDRRLALANGVLALTWSGVVPVTGFRKGRLEKARDALAAEGGEETG